jgi:cation diffusion facilitator family transporter
MEHEKGKAVPHPNSIAERRYQATKKTAVVGAVVNLVLAASKTLIGITGQSASLVADGVHSLSDLVSDALVYYVAGHARHDPDPEHPYGHGRFETVATMVLGGFLVLVAIGITWDAFVRMFAPEKLLAPSAITLYAAVFSILANEWLFRYTLNIGNQVNSDLVRANAWHHRSDAISSIVVLVGVGGTLAGLPYLDAVAAVAVGVMIARIGWDLGWGAVKELVDVGLEEERVEEIRKTILSVGGVIDFHLLRTRSLGKHASLDVHVQVEPYLSVSEGHMISLEIEERVKAEIDEIEDVTVHIDPEEDESALLCRGLPLRAEVEKILAERWQAFQEVEEKKALFLHYLAGKIEIDLVLPREGGIGPEGTRQLEEALQQALAGERIFGCVRVYQG